MAAQLAAQVRGAMDPAAVQTEEKPQLMPIAIVGMSCRLSGDVSSLEDFWEMMSRARCGWSNIPGERFSKEAYYHPNPAKMGAFNTTGGYFLKQDPALFDAPFFNITQAEAEAMDPQQRLLLECAYEAVENAGIPKERLIGQRVGVFVGGAASDYRLGTLRDLEQTPMFDATGNHQAIMSGRISHYFDLRGPSFTVDTACSSSLYALHQAVLSIRNGESEQAIVAACHWNLQPGDWISMSLSRLFSDKGMTYAFDHRAKSGFARGEGAGALILKPLDQAIRDNDNIRSVIVNTGVNQDGRTVGITSPSGKAQEQLMREVYARAGISTNDTGFVEAHGTGTKVGDPIEATAIHDVFGAGRTARSPLYLGSVKSNVGHLENASGVISIIKATMMLEKGFILPNTNFESPNESIPLQKWNMKVPVQQRPWPATKRYISINNFGFGGSNAHCVLERGPLHIQPGQKKPSLDAQQRLFVLSANDETSMKKSMEQLNIFLEQHPEIFQKGLLRNLAYTLGERRSQLSWRLAVVASTASDLAEAVASADAKPIRVSQAPPKIAFVYTGQGAQWHAMGRELLNSYPIFYDTVVAADECLKRFGADFSLLEELQRDKDASQVGKAHISQPICSAVQLGLTALLASWGIRPSSVTGHSSGEIGAAYAAGALSLEDAMAIAYHRGQAVIRMKAGNPDLKGAMMAVGAGPEAIIPLTQKLTKGVAVVACENSPSSVTVSGDDAAIDELAAEIESLQLFNRKLRVDVAYHSPHMMLAAEDYLAAIKHIVPQTNGEVEFYSSLHGKKVDLSALDPSYWVDNLTRPVRFSTSLRDLCETSLPSIIVEVGPHGALEGPVKQTLKSIGQNKVSYFSALSRGKNATTTALALAGNLFMKGQSLNFSTIHREEPGTEAPMVLSDLIPYPWSRQRYWCESRMSQQHRKKPFPRHDLLGSLADFSNNELAPTWRNILRTDEIPWLRDHKMQSLTTFPFAGFVSMAVEAAAQRATLRSLDFQSFALREIQVKRPLLMEDGAAYETMLSISPYAEGTRSYSDDWDEFRIWSWEEGKGWMEHCRGLIAARKSSGNEANLVSSAHCGITASKFQAAEKVCSEEVDVSTFYKELDTKGATYGPTFRKLSAIRASEHDSVAIIDVADTTATMAMEHQSPYYIHPALLDQVFQLSFPILGAGRTGMSTLYMPSAIQKLNIQRTTPSTAGEKIHVFGQGYPDFTNPKATDFAMAALVAPEDNEPIITLEGLRMTPVKSEGLEADAPRELCYKLEWEPADKREEDISSPAEETVTSAVPSKEASDSVLAPRPTEVEAEVRIEAVPVPEQPMLVTPLTILSSPVSEKKEDHMITINEITGSKTVSEASDSAEDTSSQSDTSEAPWSDKTVALVSDRPENDQFMKYLTDILLTRTGKETTIYTLEKAPISENQHVLLVELDQPILSELTAERFSKLQALIAGSAGLLWVTGGGYLNATNPLANMAVGLTRTVRSETAAKAATIDLDPESMLHDLGKIDLVMQAFNKVFIEEVADMEFAEKNGALFVPRIVNDEEMNLFVHRELHNSAPYLQDFEVSRRMKMAIGTTGALDTLFFHDEEQYELSEHEIEIKVEATGMNFKDVVIAMGQLPSPYLGIECAGVVSRIGKNVSSLVVGDRVCAMSEGAYSAFTRCPETSAAKIPDAMSFEVASSIPVVYCTAYYGLFELGRLCEGETVLIHAAAGGVGQAAIQLAQLVGAKIFATVGNPEKKQFIMETYGIPANCIFSSRNTSFGPAIREATGGAGVDVVINSLAGDFLRETWSCVAHFGRFIEIGKRDITSNTRLEMEKFNYNATFSSVDLTVLAKERPKHMARTFRDVMQLFETDKTKPIAPITTYGISEVETAFRLLQSGKTTGKLVVVARPGEQVKAAHPKSSDALLNNNATYLIIGGTGGLGRSISRWMASKGARTLVLVSRSGRVDSAVAKLTADLKESTGTNVIVKACDVADKDSVAQLVDFCSKELPPIAGVIHSGMVLRDVLFEKMTFEDYEAVISSKVAGTWNIHNALLNTPLDFFIAISSAAGIVGNRGQAAYAAANTFLDAFAQYRTKLGMAATAIDLTAVSDVGYLADNVERQGEVMKNLGGESICEGEVLALFTAAIKGYLGPACGNHCLTGLRLGGEGTTAEQLPYFAADAKFDYLRDTILANSSAGSGAAAQVSVGAALSKATSQEEAIGLVTAGLAGKLGGVLMVPVEDLDTETPITKYGLDSLNAIELRNWITRELGTNLQVLELLTGGSLTNLAAIILKKRAAAETKA